MPVDVIAVDADATVRFTGLSKLISETEERFPGVKALGMLWKSKKRPHRSSPAASRLADFE